MIRVTAYRIGFTTTSKHEVRHSCLAKFCFSDDEPTHAFCTIKEEESGRDTITDISQSLESHSIRELVPSMAKAISLIIGGIDFFQDENSYEFYFTEKEICDWIDACLWPRSPDSEGLKTDRPQLTVVKSNQQ